MFGKKPNYKCMQKYDPEDRDLCENGDACATCGWNVDVHNDRVRQINEEGLTLCPDGLRRLIVR